MSHELPVRPSHLGIIASLLLVIAALGYGWHERGVSKQLTAQNAQISTALDQTRNQMDALNLRLNQLSEAQAQQQAAEAQKQSAAHSASNNAIHHKAHAAVRRDDPRWKQFQSKLDEQQKAIDQTRQDLAGTRTELSGSIASTHEELVALERKGERKYYEFDLDKSKQFSQQGPVGIRLKKANTKNQFADLELMVDDAKLSQKHVNLLQPVVFYAADGGRPVELVINKVSKNHVHGYVSEPKYRQSELAAGSRNNSNDASANTTADSRQKLELPK
ncbi:MAG TPA: hypothetical protein VKW78_06350 [Terriglobales bacterium]|nr:hypothetical protein [Terriglobales bacterium]